MKILVISHFFPPEMGAAAARLMGLSRWLTEYGHDVTVVTGFPSYPTGTIPSEYKHKLYAIEEMANMKVVRTWVYASPKRGTLRRLGNYLSFMLSATIAGLFQRGSFDVVLVSSPPLFLGVSGWLLSLFKRIPWVFDIRDIWPDVAIEAGEFAADSTVTKLTTRLAHFLYHKATVITPVTQAKLHKLAGDGVDSSKMHIVSNGVDLDLVQNEVTDYRERLELGSKFVVLYAGLIGIAQGVEKTLVPAAEILRDDENIHFLIVGDGVCKKIVADEIAEKGLTNVTILPRQPKEEMSAILATASACFVPLISSNLQDAVPSKLLEAWAYRRPVVLAAAGEAAAIVEQCNGGVVVAPEEPAHLAREIFDLAADGELCEQYASSGYHYVSTNLDRKMLAKQMATALRLAVRLSGREAVDELSPLDTVEAEPHGTQV